MIMEITLLIMEKSWKNHGILFLNFCGNPGFGVSKSCHDEMVLLSSQNPGFGCFLSAHKIVFYKNILL